MHHGNKLIFIEFCEDWSSLVLPQSFSSAKIKIISRKLLISNLLHLCNEKLETESCCINRLFA